MIFESDLLGTPTMMSVNSVPQLRENKSKHKSVEAAPAGVNGYLPARTRVGPGSAALGTSFCRRVYPSRRLAKYGKTETEFKILLKSTLHFLNSYYILAVALCFISSGFDPVPGKTS